MEFKGRVCQQVFCFSKFGFDKKCCYNGSLLLASRVYIFCDSFELDSMKKLRAFVSVPEPIVPDSHVILIDRRQDLVDLLVFSYFQKISTLFRFLFMWGLCVLVNFIFSNMQLLPCFLSELLKPQSFVYSLEDGILSIMALRWVKALAVALTNVIFSAVLVPSGLRCFLFFSRIPPFFLKPTCFLKSIRFCFRS